MRELAAQMTPTIISTTPGTPEVLDTAAVEALATSVAQDGPDAHAREVLTFAYAARGRDVSTVLLDVLTDPAAPEVVRLRAFGLIVRALARPARAAASAPMLSTPVGRHRQPVLV